MTVEEFEAGVRTGEIVPETPVEVDGAWIAAREWPTWAALRSSTEAQLHALWKRRSVPWVTAITLGLTIQVFRMELTKTGTTLGLLDQLSRDTTAILERGEGWRILSYGLLHADPNHILSNSAAVAVAGWALETMIGHRGALAVLVVSTATGAALGTLFSPEIPSVGISGGAFGLLGACAVLGLRYFDIIPVAARAAFGTTAALFTLWAVVGGMTGERVDSWCHLGGLIAGLGLGAVYRPRVSAWERTNRWVDAGSLALVLSLVVAPLVAGLNLVPWKEWRADGAVARRPAWWTLQVSKSGLGGYGNGDRSSVISLDTARHEAPPTVSAVLQDTLLVVRRLDAAATLRQGEDDRATLTYHTGSEPRVVELRVFIRGLYATTAAVDTRPDARFAPVLRRTILDDVQLATPDDLADDLASATSGSWKSQVAGAAALASLGDVAGASLAFEAARERGDAAVVDAAEIEVLAALRHPSAPMRIEAALAASPADRRLRATATRAYATLGEPSMAQALALALVMDAPTPRSAAAATALLTEVGGSLPATAPGN